MGSRGESPLKLSDYQQIMMLLYDLYVVTQMIIIMIVMVGHSCYGTCDFEYCLYIIPYRLSLIYGLLWLFEYLLRDSVNI